MHCLKHPHGNQFWWSSHTFWILLRSSCETKYLWKSCEASAFILAPNSIAHSSLIPTSFLNTKRESYEPFFIRASLSSWLVKWNVEALLSMPLHPKANPAHWAWFPSIECFSVRSFRETTPSNRWHFFGKLHPFKRSIDSNHFCHV